MFHDPDFLPFVPREKPRLRSSFGNYLENWPPAGYREDIFSFRGFWPFIPKTVYLTDPDLIEEMLVTRAEFFTRDYITTRSLAAPVGRTSLFFAEGAEWKWQRRATAPTFRHENLLALVPTFSRCAEAQAREWRALPANSRIDAMEATSRTTFSVMEQALLGAQGMLDREKFLDALRITLAGVSWTRILALFSLPRGTPFPGAKRVAQSIRYLYDEVDRLYAARRASVVTGDDILSRLLAARDPETGRAMTDGEITGNMNGFLIAGHETSAVALGWALWLLAKDQASQERVRREVLEIAGSDSIDPNTVEKLPFTRQVVLEAMRMFPPAAVVARQPREDTTLGPYKVSRKDPIYVALWCLHRHEKYWDEPHGFDPDRFAPEKVKARPRYAYLPFGAGHRICIGMSFAMLEMVAMLGTFVREFHFGTVPGHRLELDMAFTTRAKGGLPLLLEPREGVQRARSVADAA